MSKDIPATRKTGSGRAFVIRRRGNPSRLLSTRFPTPKLESWQQNSMSSWDSRPRPKRAQDFGDVDGLALVVSRNPEHPLQLPFRKGGEHSSTLVARSFSDADSP